MAHPLISVVVPCYNEEESLPLFYEVICGVAEGMTQVAWEFDFIDDGSSDGTLALLRGLAQKDDRVRYTSFSRNFGKEAGILAGLTMSQGDYAVLMDADLQHPPEMLPDMYERLATGDFDCVTARRVSRKGEPPIRSFFSRLFYRVINRISKVEFVSGASDFRMMSRKMVDAVLSLSEYNRFSKGIFGWVGFRNTWVPYENVERVAGETKWSFWKLLKYSMDGIMAFSTAPLVISSVAGIVACIVAMVMMVVVVVKTLIFGDPVAGFPTLISVILLVGGLQMLFIGILGQYLSKTYLETKRRPPYIVRETESEVKACEREANDTLS